MATNSKNRSATERMVRSVQAAIGAGILMQVYGSKTFAHCMMELVKNARDWGASIIYVDTATKAYLRIVDNGDGMTERNRNSFASVNMSSGGGRRQSAKYGSGSKKMLYSHSLEVTVRTVTAEDPDNVYTFSLTTSEYEKVAMASGTIPMKVVPKNRESWPYDFPTGTDLTYKLARPDSRAIYRGDRLAEELSARLPLMFTDQANIVRVDGKPLPPKKIRGEVFRISIPRFRSCGDVTVELYRPELRNPEEGLRFTAHEIGEADVRAFKRAIGANLAATLPDLYSMPGVCGTVRADFLREHSAEDRESLSPEMASDFRAQDLVGILCQYEADAAAALQYKIERVSEASDDGVMVHQVLDSFTRKYGKDGPPVDVGPGPGGPPTHPPTSGPGIAVRPPMRLELRRHEFSLGETIFVRPVFDKEFGEQYDARDLKWHTDRARAGKVKKVDGGIEYSASELGTAVVSAEIPGTLVSAQASYQVVDTRVFRLTNSLLRVRMGEETLLMTANSDMLKGEVGWKLDGVGSITAEGGRVRFQSDRVGMAIVTAFDTKNSKVRATCDITVVGPDKQLVCVDGQWFEYRVLTVKGAGAQEPPVRMEPGSKVHEMYVNCQQVGYLNALANGELLQFLRFAIAETFSRFFATTLSGVEWTQVLPTEIPQIMDEMRDRTYRIVNDMSGSK